MASLRKSERLISSRGHRCFTVSPPQLPVSSVNQSSVSLWCDQREASSSSDHGMVKGGVSLGVICFKSCLVVFLFCVLYMDERYVFGGQ